jgi:hypothetical protein
LGETSYGGSSLARALSALPMAVPVVGDGDQVFNPMHARDLGQGRGGLSSKPATAARPARDRGA